LHVPFFFPFTEELVLEESPKWKLLADVLDEIERDDAKNDTKRTLHFFVVMFIKALFLFQLQ
jgi:dolichol kinase